MREIKFRAWRPSIKLMGISFKLGQQWGEFPEETIFMQFTGLLDKLGQEIYEGDIVRLESYSKNDPRKIQQVVFMLEQYTDVEGRDPHKASFTTPLGQSLEQCEVIGNIYENPELLEEG